MNTTKPTYSPGSGFVNREIILLLVNAALKTKSLRFAKQVCSQWLGTYPGDLEAAFYMACALFEEGKFSDSEAVLRKICALDPEYLDAQMLLNAIQKEKNPEEFALTLGALATLGYELDETEKAPDWGKQLRKAILAMEQGQLDEAQEIVFGVISQNVQSPLPAIVHLYLARRRDDDMGIYNLARLYNARWPEGLVFKLYLADTLLKRGDEISSVSILHQCAANDAIGQTPRRLWGERHPYRELWPEYLEINLDIPIPADVAALLGWNQLIAGNAPKNQAQPENCEEKEHIEEERIVFERAETISKNIPVSEPVPVVKESVPVTPEPQPERELIERKDVYDALKPVSDAFGRISKRLKRPEIGRMDGRFPMYVIFSTRRGLNKQYGQQTAGIIDQELKKLAQAIRKRPGWGAMVFYPDDVETSLGLGLPAVESIDPWQLKLSLVELDKALAKKGAMIGSLLIVGGPDVVPFHLLPNPTDDLDKDVPSDNPYSTLDANYFVPEWPVGRLPGEAGSDAGLLLEQVRRLNLYHSGVEQVDTWWQRLCWLLRGIRRIRRLASKTIDKEALGYSAAAWRRSSVAVFRPLGMAEGVLISPPEYSGSLNPDIFTNSRMSYYNLHGLPDSPEWYGQRDANDTSGEGPDYPVAIHVKDLMKNGHAPDIVFSEACYGGHIFAKTEAQALVLRFLNIGTKVVCASTCIAYGSVNAPLLGGDLLGYLFWKYSQEGYTSGEALMKAKIEMVREMTRRQGFLDGEDQKTLISFVLYGDPLMRYKELRAKNKILPRTRTHFEVKTVSDKPEEGAERISIPKEVIRQVKTAVEPYLPGLDDAKIIVGQEHFIGDGDQEVSSKQGTAVKGKKNTEAEEGRVVVTISKEVLSLDRLHRHYARATLDNNGKVVKLAISR